MCISFSIILHLFLHFFYYHTLPINSFPDSGLKLAQWQPELVLRLLDFVSRDRQKLKLFASLNHKMHSLVIQYLRSNKTTGALRLSYYAGFEKIVFKKNEIKVPQYILPPIEWSKEYEWVFDLFDIWHSDITIAFLSPDKSLLLVCEEDLIGYRIFQGHVYLIHILCLKTRKVLRKYTMNSLDMESISIGPDSSSVYGYYKNFLVIFSIPKK